MERFKKYLREVRAELYKTSWPNRKELRTYTVVVLVLVAIVSVFVGVVDVAFGELVNVLRRLGG
ncbi:MAG: preprotein translocase subunit SecE [Firmicutes bacterium]|nr:preprotein translocase subunit SecE [Bacillota bacterium]